jgi:acyl-CoA thioesterase FadM
VYRAEDRVHRASGTLTVVAVDKPTMKPEPVPDWLRAALARFTR